MTNVDVNDPNYLAYAYVFGTSAFRLTDAKVLVQNGQVTNITDPKITPLFGDFDFDPQQKNIRTASSSTTDVARYRQTGSNCAHSATLRLIRASSL
jgi:hypothetical protein